MTAMTADEMRELDIWLGINAMGWELVDLDYYEDCQIPGYVQCKSGFNTPSVQKWDMVLEDEKVEAVGIYWIDPISRKVVRAENGFNDWPPFHPTTDPAAAFALLQTCAESFHEPIRIYRMVSENAWVMNCYANLDTGIDAPIEIEAPTLELAIAKFSRSLFSNAK